MKLNHLDIQVADVPRTAAIFERVFGLRRKSRLSSPAIAILSDDDGFVLVLQRAKHGETYPEGFHLGFFVDDVAVVERVQQGAREEGWEVSDFIRNGRGTMIYCRAPEGYLVEVGVQRLPPQPALIASPSTES